MVFLKGLLTAFVFAAVVQSAAIDYATIIESRDIKESYDYVIVGSGTAGSTVAYRLTEDPKVSVLVIEAGPLDQQEDDVLIPSRIGWTMFGKYDWNFTSTTQEYLEGRQIRLPVGRVVGGSSVLNGMMFDRGAAADYDAWEEMGNPGWGWKGLLPYFKKSETFHPPSKEQAKEFGITYDPKAHGYNGPIHSSYPPFLPTTHRLWFRLLKAVGIPTERDGANGRAINAFWSPNSLDPENMTRSYARVAHFDPAKKRKNFHAIVGNTVTKIIPKDAKASPLVFEGVEFGTDVGSPRQIVKAKKEVILSAGVVGSVRVLQYSGIGPAAPIRRYQIPHILDLPGVGTNFQDHGYDSIQFTFDKPPPPTVIPPNGEELYRKNKTGPWTMSGPNAIAFLSLPDTAERNLVDGILDIVANDDPTRHLRPGAHPTEIEGYKKQLKVLAKHLRTKLMGGNEFLWQGAGMSLSQAHPFSRGVIEINTPNPFNQPNIDFRFFSNPYDWNVTLIGFRFARKIMQTDLAAEFEPRETMPGTSIQTDWEWRQHLRARWSTMFHPSCSNPMQPQELGGVVDSELKVYGTANLRIIDASIFPLIPGTHTQSTTYAVAEKGADIIKAAAKKRRN